MRKLRKILLLVITIPIIFSLCACTYTREYIPRNYKNDLDKQIFVNGKFPNMEYSATTFEKYINKSYFEEYPYVDGYYGYYRDEYYLKTKISLFGFNKEISSVLNYGSDERLFAYIRYDDEIYQKAKEYLMAAGDLNLYEPPIEEYNGYVFYHGFGSDKKANDFGNFVYNDSNNTIILLAFYYHEPEENNSLGLYYNTENNSYHLEDCEWHEYIEMLFGSWYNFSE